MSLVGVEIRRGLARRSTRALITLAVALIAFMGVLVFLSSRSGFNDAEARADAARERDAYVNDCVASHGFGGEVGIGPGQDVRSACAATAGGLDEFTHDKRFKLTELWHVDEDDGVLAVTGLFLVIGALMAGATFIGGDWRYGTVTTLLTWESRRLRVFAAKAAAVFGVAFVIGVVLQLLVAGVLYPSAVFRGTTEGADGDWLVGVAGAIVRTSTLGACAALVGFAIASLGRNTAAALGLAFGYVAVFEALVRGLKPEWQPWLIGENSTVFLFGHQLDSADFERTLLEAVAILLAYLGAVLVASGVAFSRRDVAA